MIEIKKEDKYSIYFKFDREDLENTKKAFETASANQKMGEINNVSIDSKLFKKNEKTNPSILFVKMGTNGLYSQDNQYFLELDKDDLEYGAEMLNFCINKGFFEVAEFAKISTPKARGLVDVYFCVKN